MKTVLVVSPHFPPINAPDMHRVRISLPYFSEFGWKPVVLAVDPKYIEAINDPLLLEIIPSDIVIHRVTALPVYWTRKIGVGNLGLRAFPFLYKTGCELIKKYSANLIYFSTTMFPVMTLGRIWKRQFGVPYVLDIQDPWVSDYYENKPKSERPPKYWLAQCMHKILEPWTLKKINGIIAVSEVYHEILRNRYSCIPEELCRTIPFGASNFDFEIAAKIDGNNPYFQRGDGFIHGVYVGVLGKIMMRTCFAICLAFRQGLEENPELFLKVRLHFIGTDYAPAKRAKATIRPIAEKLKLGEYIQEDTQRVSYFTALNLLRDANFLIVPGSDDPGYTASKIYPYILAQKPLLAIFHKGSSVVNILRTIQAGNVVTFTNEISTISLAQSVFEQWTKFLRCLPFEPKTNWEAFRPYMARETTRQQCELFDHVLDLNRK